MSMEITRILCSKHDGEQAGVSSIFNISANTTAKLTLSIPVGYVLYLVEFGGISTTSDVDVLVRDRLNNILQEYAELPDVFVMIPYYPFLKDKFKGNVNFLFTNNTSGTSTITFIVNGFLVPEGTYEQFERELVNFSRMPKMLGGGEQCHNE